MICGLSSVYLIVFNRFILKESLHIILMTIVFFEINMLHSLGYKQMITKEKIYEKIS